MKLNHLNLTVTDASEARKFLEKYFELKSMDIGEDNNRLALLHDDDGLELTLMKVGGEGSPLSCQLPHRLYSGNRNSGE